MRFSVIIKTIQITGLLTIFVIVFSLSFGSCKSSQLISKKILTERELKIQKKPSDSYNYTDGKITEKVTSKWITSKIDVKHYNNFSAIHFINEDTGWAVNKNSVVKTEDSGKNWKVFPIDFIKKSRVVSIHFTTNLNGWIVLQEGGDDSYAESDQVKIYRSTNGGKTWNLSVSIKSAVIDDSYFYNDEGWIIATRFLGFHPQRLVPEVYFFSGEISKWNNVSKSLIKLSYDSQYGEDTYPTLARIAFEKNKCVLVVNTVEKIFKSCNKGKSWELERFIRNTKRPSEYGLKEIGSKDDFIWTLQSVGGYYHGGSSLITILPKNSQEESKLLGLSDYYSHQGFSISSDEFFLIARRYDVNIPNPKYKGLILYTNNGGKTWEKISRIEPEIKVAQLLYSDLSKTFIILSEEGNIYKVNHQIRKRI